VKRLRALLWPAAVLVAGLLAGAGAEIAAGRFGDYGLYGLMRPVADLLLVIGAIWLAAAGLRLALARRRRR